MSGSGFCCSIIFDVAGQSCYEVGVVWWLLLGGRFWAMQTADQLTSIVHHVLCCSSSPCTSACSVLFVLLGRHPAYSTRLTHRPFPSCCYHLVSPHPTTQPKDAEGDKAKEAAAASAGGDKAEAPDTRQASDKKDDGSKAAQALALRPQPPPPPPPPSIKLKAVRLGKQLLEPHAYSLSSKEWLVCIAASIR